MLTIYRWWQLREVGVMGGLTSLLYWQENNRVLLAGVAWCVHFPLGMPSKMSSKFVVWVQNSLYLITKMSSKFVVFDFRIISWWLKNNSCCLNWMVIYNTSGCFNCCPQYNTQMIMWFWVGVFPWVFNNAKTHRNVRFLPIHIALSLSFSWEFLSIRALDSVMVVRGGVRCSDFRLVKIWSFSLLENMWVGSWNTPHFALSLSFSWEFLSIRALDFLW